MPSLAFRIVNVFTRDQGVLTGNPLCVFENGAGIDTGTMQALARQFNLSETTFILPSETATAKVRIFTPSYEMPFAGHPTLGTSHVCRILGLGNDDLHLEMKAGIIPVTARANRWSLQAKAPVWRNVEVPNATLAALLRIDAAAIAAAPLWISTGKEQLLVQLDSTETVRRVQPDSSQFAEMASADGQLLVYVFAANGPNRMLARAFFASGSTVLEDPATGSAAANLGGWMLATERRLPLSCEISQGEQVGRPSTLFLDVDDGGKIHVAGEVIELARGTLQL